MVASPANPTMPITLPCEPAPAGRSLSVRRVVIAAMDSAGRVTIGQLRLPEGWYLVAEWSPVMLLAPTGRERADAARRVDARSRLLLRPADADILGSRTLLVARCADDCVALCAALPAAQFALRELGGNEVGS